MNIILGGPSRSVAYPSRGPNSPDSIRANEKRAGYRRAAPAEFPLEGWKISAHAEITQPRIYGVRETSGDNEPPLLLH
jgi:hypothetical protein